MLSLIKLQYVYFIQEAYRISIISLKSMNQHNIGANSNTATRDLSLHRIVIARSQIIQRISYSTNYE